MDSYLLASIVFACVFAGSMVGLWLNAWLPENHVASFAIVALLVLAVTGCAIRGLELGKWVHNIGGISILVVLLTVVVLC